VLPECDLNSLPLLTVEIPGTGGSIRVEPEDFVVEEIPLFEPAGEGEHLYVTVTKRGLSTVELVRRMAKALGIPPSRFGFAGLKDRHSVSTQTISIQGVSEGAIEGLSLPGVTVQRITRHRHKLRAGALQGNSFKIVIRNLKRADRSLIEQVIREIRERGFPNYFGVQRFGARGGNHEVGRALLKRNWQAALDLLVGVSSGGEPEEIRRAREAFRSGDWQEALRLFGRKCRLERQLVKRLVASKGSAEKAVKAIPKPLRRLLLSAYQSYFFNLALAVRLKRRAFDTLWEGDIAVKHETGGLFRVEDPAAEAPRLKAFEISPTGPVFGWAMMEASGAEGELERRLLEEEEVHLEDFRNLFPGLKLKGTRRSFRAKAHQLQWALSEDRLFVSFRLQSGVYATSLLREIMQGGGKTP